MMYFVKLIINLFYQYLRPRPPSTAQKDVRGRAGRPRLESLKSKKPRSVQQVKHRGTHELVPKASALENKTSEKEIVSDKNIGNEKSAETYGASKSSITVYDPEEIEPAIRLLSLHYRLSNDYGRPLPTLKDVNSAWGKLEHPLADYIRACVATETSIKLWDKHTSKREWLDKIERLAATDHEIIIRAIKKGAVLEASERATQTIIDSAARLYGEELDIDLTALGVQVRKKHIRAYPIEKNLTLFPKLLWIEGSKFLEFVEPEKGRIAIATIELSDWITSEETPPAEDGWRKRRSSGSLAKNKKSSDGGAPPDSTPSPKI